MKLSFDVTPYAELLPTGLQLTIINDNYEHVVDTVSFDDLYENTVCGILNDEQMTDVANALEELANDIRSYILTR